MVLHVIGNDETRIRFPQLAPIMWVKIDYDGTLRELIEEVKAALIQFEKDRDSGLLQPVSNSEKY